MATFTSSRFVFIHLVGGHIENAIKDVDAKSLNQGKLKNTNIMKNTYPVKMELSQNKL